MIFEHLCDFNTDEVMALPIELWCRLTEIYSDVFLEWKTRCAILGISEKTKEFFPPTVLMPEWEHERVCGILDFDKLPGLLQMFEGHGRFSELRASYRADPENELQKEQEFDKTSIMCSKRNVCFLLDVLNFFQNKSSSGNLVVDDRFKERYVGVNFQDVGYVSSFGSDSERGRTDVEDSSSSETSNGTKKKKARVRKERKAVLKGKKEEKEIEIRNVEPPRKIVMPIMLITDSQEASALASPDDEKNPLLFE
jgi:hypothetical protein